MNSPISAAELANGIAYGDNGGPLFGSPDDWHITALAHGVAQGSLGWVAHNDFWTGFVSGSTSHAVGHHVMEVPTIVARTAIATSAGALLAKATGGDAMQGAVTAMLVHLFNKEKEIYNARAEMQKRLASLDLDNKHDRAFLAGYAVATGVLDDFKEGIPYVRGNNAHLLRLAVRDQLIRDNFPIFKSRVAKFVDSFYFDPKTGVFGVGLILNGIGSVSGALFSTVYSGLSSSDTLRGVEAFYYNSDAGASLVDTLELHSMIWYDKNAY